MKDLQGTLRRIDEEITACRQQIAGLQVTIVRLEDSRRMLLGLAEADEAARQIRAADRQHAGEINGAHAKPLITVRKVGKPERKRRFPTGTIREERREAVREALGDGGALTSTEMADRLAIPKGKQRTEFRTVLRAMTAEGELSRTGKRGSGSRGTEGFRYQLALSQ